MMKFDENKEREARLRKVPGPVLRRDPDLQRQEVEDDALDSMLKVMAFCKDDGDDFLRRVNARVGRESNLALSHEDSDPSFFGLAPSLVKKVEPTVQAVEKPVEPVVEKTTWSRKRPALLALASITAALLVGVFIWQSFGAKTEDGSQLVAVASEKEIYKGDSHKPATTKKAEAEIVRAVPSKLVEAVETDTSVEENASSTKPPTPPTLSDASQTKPSAQPSPAPSIDPWWEFRLEFDHAQVGTVWIGQREVQTNITMRGAVGTFKTICHEVAKHVHFYSPILERKWQGKLGISGPGFQFEETFDGLDEMFAAGIEVRTSFREHVTEADILPKPEPGHAFVKFPKLTQLVAVHERAVRQSLSVTDEILRAELNPAIFRESNLSHYYKNFRQIGKGEVLLSSVNKDGDLELLREEVQFEDLEGFGTKDTVQLKQQLKETPQFELFDGYKQFKHWANMVARVTDVGRISSEISDLQEEESVFLAKFKSKRINETELESQRQRIHYRIAQLRENLLTANSKPNVLKIDPLVSLLPEKMELEGFDLAMGDACHLEDGDATTLNEISQHFGRMVSEFDVFGSRRRSNQNNPHRVNMFKNLVRGIAYHDNPNQAIGTVDQMLQIEQAGVRLELVNALGQLDNESACKLLACYAKYDVEPEVRIAATDELRSFPPEMARKELLSGFRYPWPEAARHSAEAIVRLNDTGAIPKLVGLLKKQDPRMPRRQENGVFVHREMVAINHLRNCMLCHQDSHSEKDPGRGLIPYWKRTLPVQYYSGRDPQAPRVRADVTYLRQDFSVVREVEEPGLWPDNQRFDYVARTKALTRSQASRLSHKISSEPNEYRIAIDKALRMLTNKSPADDSWKSWQAAVGEL